MVMTIGIVFVLVMGFYSGARRGLVLQLVLTIGYVASYYVASQYYSQLAAHLELLIPYPSATESTQFVFYDQVVGFNLDVAFYNGIAFLIILFAGWLITRFIGGLLNALTFVPIVKQLNTLGGGLLNFVVSYAAVFLLLLLLTMLPVDSVQEQFNDSSLARWIVQDTPVLSEQIYQWWIESGF